jgi:hypothetical protein
MCVFWSDLAHIACEAAEEVLVVTRPQLLCARVFVCVCVRVFVFACVCV